MDVSDKFVEEMNKELMPVLEITKNVDRNYPHFSLELCETRYAMKDQVVVEWKVFEQLVRKKAAKYFKEVPAFNNVGRVFWFI